MTEEDRKDKIERIAGDLKKYQNIAYINGTRKFPLCVTSAMICCLIEMKKLNDIKIISVDNDITLIKELQEKAGGIPAFYYGGRLIACGENLKKLIKQGR